MVELDTDLGSVHLETVVKSHKLVETKRLMANTGLVGIVKIVEREDVTGSCDATNGGGEIDRLGVCELCEELLRDRTKGTCARIEGVSLLGPCCDAKVWRLRSEDASLSTVGVTFGTDCSSRSDDTSNGSLDTVATSIEAINIHRHFYKEKENEKKAHTCLGIY